MKISIVTVTNRYGGIDISWNSLKKQTFKDFEWILLDKHYHERHKEVAEFVNDERLKHYPIHPPKVPEVWDLNRAYNQAARLSIGDIIISYQDYIWLEEDSVDRFVHLANKLGPGNWITGCGHKGQLPDDLGNKEGKITIFHSNREAPPMGFSYMDSRVFGQKEPQEVELTWFELNWACFWKKDLYTIGGFDEELDKLCYGCDNLSLAERAHMLGHKFWIDRSNKVYGFPHEKYFPRPVDWEPKHGNKGFYSKRMKDYENNPVLPFLGGK